MSTIHFNLRHLELMISNTESIRAYHLLSASKQKRILELSQVGLVKIDEANHIFNTECGDAIIDLLITEFNKYAQGNLMP